MGTINDHERLPSQNLQPPRPANPSQPLPDAGLGNVDAPLPQLLHNSDNYGGIIQLMPAQQRYPKSPTCNLRPETRNLKPLTFQVRLSRFPRPVAADHRQLGIPLPAHLFDDSHSLWRLRGTDHQSLVLDNACLLPRDQGQGLAQDMSVIVAEGGYDSHQGIDHVGGIQPPAHAYLQNRELHPLLDEIEKAQGSDDLESGDTLDPAHQGLQPLSERSHRFFGNQPAIGLDPLAEGMQVRRGVEPRAVASGSQDRFAHRCHRTLALGSGNVNGLEMPVGVIEPGQQLFHASQIEALRPVQVRAFLLVIGETVDVVERVLVS